jgi:hypothetical protein
MKSEQTLAISNIGQPGRGKSFQPLLSAVFRLGGKKKPEQKPPTNSAPILSSATREYLLKNDLSAVLALPPPQRVN